jgi:hypothetical protein
MEGRTRCYMEGRITTPPTMSGVQQRARQGKAEGISRPNKAKPYTSETCGVQRLPSKALGKHPDNACGEAQPLGTGAREPGCEQTRKDDEGQIHPSSLLGLADRAWPNHARQTRRRWKLWNGQLHSRPLPRRRVNQTPHTGVSYPAPLTR